MQNIALQCKNAVRKQNPSCQFEENRKLSPTQTTLTRFRAAVFDLDGTLVHSEHAGEAAKIEVLAQHGLVPSQALLDAHVGRGLDGFLDEAFDKPLLSEQRNSIGNRIGAAADLLLPKMREPIPGATELLRKLHESRVRIAICSSSPRRHIGWCTCRTWDHRFG